MAKNGPSKAEIKFKMVEDIVSKANGGDGFSAKIAAWETNDGKRTGILHTGLNTCQHLNMGALQTLIHQEGYLRQPLSEHYMFTRGDAQDVATTALAAVPIVPRPKAFRFASDNSLAYAALSFDPSPGETPAWDSLTARMDNAPAFVQYIGSLFFDESYRHQYLWCHGEGGDGKGAIGRWLMRIFNGAAVSFNDMEKTDKWLGSKIVNARVVLLTDFQRYGFTSTGLFMSLSGGDSLYVEEKYEKGYNVNPNFKFIFLSNQMPHLSSKDADRRRAILVEFVESAKEVEAGFEDRLWAEAPHFIHRAIEAYKEACPTHGPIVADTSALDDFISIVEEPFEVLFEEVFTLTKGKFISAAEMGYALEQKWPKDRQMQMRFLSWLKSAKNIKKGAKTLTIPGLGASSRQVLKVYFNLDFAKGVESAFYRKNYLAADKTVRNRPTLCDELGVSVDSWGALT